MSETPKGWNKIALGDLLDEAQIEGVLAIMREPCSDYQKTAKLKDFLRPYAAQLEAKGVLVDYLAYALPYWLGQTAQQAKADEEAEAKRRDDEFMRNRLN